MADTSSWLALSFGIGNTIPDVHTRYLEMSGERDITLDIFNNAKSPDDRYVVAAECEREGSPLFMKMAISHYTFAGNNGHVEACVRLMEIYSERLDEDMTAYWLKRAAECGDAISQYRMYCMLASSTDASASVPCAIAWLEKAVAQEYPPAVFSLALRLHEKDTKRSDELMLLAAQLGEDRAQVVHANSLADPRERICWMARAANKKNAEACAFLCDAYHEGVGVKEDHARAIEWRNRAAEAGHAGCQINLAVELLFSDIVAARDCMQRAAHGGCDTAQFNMYKMLSSKPELAIEEHESLEWLTKAADQNNISALAEMTRGHLQKMWPVSDERTGLDFLRRVLATDDEDSKRELLMELASLKAVASACCGGCGKAATTGCGKCRVARYCSKACGKHMWTVHKLHCLAWQKH